MNDLQTPDTVLERCEARINDSDREALHAAVEEIRRLKNENQALRKMIDLGLGWDDLKTDGAHGEFL